MDINALRIFSVLASEKSLSSASKLLNTPDKNIHDIMVSLQAELGCSLFVRSGDQVLLTKTGTSFLECCRSVLDCLDSFYSSINAFDTEPATVSISLLACSSLLMPLLTSFRETYRSIDLRISLQAPDTPCDFSIRSESAPVTSPRSILLLKEPFCLVVSKSHRLAHRKSVCLRDLADESFIIHSRANPLRRIVEKSCRLSGFVPKIITETDSIMIFSQLLSANCGICMVPALTNRSLFENTCSLIEIEEPRIYRYLTLNWEQELTATQMVLKDFITSFFLNLPQSRKKVFVQTFGRFDVYINGTPVYFRSRKSKEYLALLVDRQGGIVTMEQAIDCLWENEPYDSRIKRRYRSIIIALRATLKEYEIEDMVTFKRAGAYINKNCFDCDLYEFLSGSGLGQALFSGDYLTDYSWGEHMIPLLNHIDT